MVGGNTEAPTGSSYTNRATCSSKDHTARANEVGLAAGGSDVAFKKMNFLPLVCCTEAWI